MAKKRVINPFIFENENVTVNIKNYYDILVQYFSGKQKRIISTKQSYISWDEQDPGDST